MENRCKQPYYLQRFYILNSLYYKQILLPLNRPDRLRRHVIADPVDTFDLLQDPVRDMRQETERYILDGRCHGILGIDCPDDDRILE